jgi:uncharacterized protein
VHKSLRSIQRASIQVIPKKKLSITKDPDDNKFLECALQARADYVVTGNIRDPPAKFQDIRIVSPKQFLAILASDLS